MGPLVRYCTTTFAALALASLLLMGVVAICSAAGLPAPGSAAGLDQEGGSRDSMLRTLVAEALQYSPLLIAARDDWLAQAKRPIQAATLPDPQFTLQNLAVGNPIPGHGLQSNNFAYVGYGFSEDIPYPGKLALQAAIASRDAEAAHAEFEARQRQIAEQVRETYFNLSYLANTLNILRQSYAEFQRIEQITQSQYELGTAQQQDVLKAQLEMTTILREMQATHEQFDQGQADLRAILGRTPDSPEIRIGRVTLTTFNLDSKVLRKLALTQSPELRKARLQQARSKESLRLAREGYIPDFNVSYMYQKTGAAFPDYYMATLGVRIPLFFWRKQTPAVEQAALKEDAAHAQARATQLAVLSQMQNQLIAARSTHQIAQTYEDGLIPQAQTTLASATAAYRVGKIDFQTLLDSELNLLTLREQYYRTVVDHEIAIARIRQIVGELP